MSRRFVPAGTLTDCAETQSEATFALAFCDDPAHHWIRAEWENAPLDPRCPMCTAEGTRL